MSDIPDDIRTKAEDIARQANARLWDELTPREEKELTDLIAQALMEERARGIQLLEQILHDPENSLVRNEKT